MHVQHERPGNCLWSRSEPVLFLSLLAGPNNRSLSSFPIFKDKASLSSLGRKLIALNLFSLVLAFLNPTTVYTQYGLILFSRHQILLTVLTLSGYSKDLNIFDRALQPIQWNLKSFLNHFPIRTTCFSPVMNFEMKGGWHEKEYF